MNIHNEQIDKATIIKCKLCEKRFTDTGAGTPVYKLEQHIVIKHIYELAEVVTPATDGL